jgi:uncharacterized protein (DUF427 family)
MNRRRQHRDQSRLERLPCAKRVRVMLAGQFVADSRDAILLREPGAPPLYYFPKHDVRRDLLIPSDKTAHCPIKGTARYWTLKVGEDERRDAVWSYPDGVDGYLAFDWDSMDAWFEEDEEVFAHPRDPFTRVDVLQSSRSVRVVAGDRTVAETTRPVLLFETGLPVRYYFPKTDVELAWLVTSDTLTRCPYKGEARHYSLQRGAAHVPDVAWCYPYPTQECAKIAGLIAFYVDRVDAFYVDGVLHHEP